MYRSALTFIIAALAFAAPLGAQSRGWPDRGRGGSYELGRRRDDDGHVKRRYVDASGRVCTEKVHTKKNGDRKYTLDCKARKGKHAKRYGRQDRYERDDRDGDRSGYPSRYPTSDSRYPARSAGSLADIVSVVMGAPLPERR